MAFSKCPWCGGDARVDIVDYEKGGRQVGFSFWVKCSKCGATKGTTYKVIFELEEDGKIRIIRDEIELAEKDWNMRVADFGWKDGK